MEGGVRAWIVGIESGFIVTFLGLIPICSISNCCLNGKQSAEKVLNTPLVQSTLPFQLNKIPPLFPESGIFAKRVQRHTIGISRTPYSTPLTVSSSISSRHISHVFTFTSVQGMTSHTRNHRNYAICRTGIKVNTPEQLSRVTLKIFRSCLLHLSTIDF